MLLRDVIDLDATYSDGPDGDGARNGEDGQAAANDDQAGGETGRITQSRGDVDRRGTDHLHVTERNSRGLERDHSGELQPELALRALHHREGRAFCEWS